MSEPCKNCGRESTGPARRVAGYGMVFTCSTACCEALERRWEAETSGPRVLLAACLAYFEDMRKQPGGDRFAPDDRWLAPIRAYLDSDAP